MKRARRQSKETLMAQKRRRQEEFLRRVASGSLSMEQALDEARLIPKDIVQQFKVLNWVK